MNKQKIKERVLEKIRKIDEDYDGIVYEAIDLTIQETAKEIFDDIKLKAIKRKIENYAPWLDITVEDFNKLKSKWLK